VPRSLCKSLGIGPANLLIYLLNVGQGNSDDAGWIQATERFVLDGIGMSPERQERLLGRLEKAGFLEVGFAARTRGTGELEIVAGIGPAGKRYIRIIGDAVRRDLGL
jgi:hypothetical protein